MDHGLIEQLTLAAGRPHEKTRPCALVLALLEWRKQLCFTKVGHRTGIGQIGWCMSIAYKRKILQKAKQLHKYSIFALVISLSGLLMHANWLEANWNSCSSNRKYCVKSLVLILILCWAWCICAVSSLHEEWTISKKWQAIWCYLFQGWLQSPPPPKEGDDDIADNEHVGLVEGGQVKREPDFT